MNRIYLKNSWIGRGVRRLLPIVLTLALLVAVLPHNQAQAQQPGTVNKLSPALQQALNNNINSVWSNPDRQTVRVLIQTTGAVQIGLITAITLQGGSVVRQFTSINGLLVELPKNKVLTIAARADVERMSADHLAQQSASHLEVATGADRLRTYNSLTQKYSGLDGTGVGIAILDSGIMASHSEFGNLGNLLNLSRVTARTDTVSSNTNLVQYLLRLGIVANVLDLLGLANKDTYGHGTHVAGTAAGRSVGNNSSRGFNGIAPNANLIDVRVLNGRGVGQTSDVIAGIDWVIANRVSRNIKVMNLSLGAASSESYLTDPLCRAVRRATA
ncbi:MAG TPA: S8 family serine peptidase, partial [Burkholderiaceae bacterium]|nr:S8 family serine peptidase [Burkholderiaceae bacterium]